MLRVATTERLWSLWRLRSCSAGQPSRPRTAFANGAILALTHVGLAVALVLAGYAVISRAFAYGGRTPQFETASGVLIILIGAYLLWTSLTHRHDASPKGRSLRRISRGVNGPKGH